MANARDEAERLFAEGEGLAAAEQDAEALTRFRAAWDALPEPKAEQESAIRILAALADSHFYLGEWEGCLRAVQDALRCGADVGNPFLRLRLGQSLYELGDEQEAANWLVPVYLAEGRGPFESDDPKYLEFFRGRLAPPPGGWPEGW
jgi:tetratricopeptide (TPR) repeat protein